MVGRYVKLNYTMGIQRLIKLFKTARENGRSKAEIFETFRDAGIITAEGDLKAPYEDIYIPVEETSKCDE